MNEADNQVEAQPPGPVAERTPRRWATVLLVIGLLAGGTALVYWRISPSAARVAIALPPLPDLAAKPAELRDRLTAASAAAARPHPALEAVAELARLYHENGFLSEAQACWEWLRVAQPLEPKWVYYLADVRRTSGDYEADERLLNNTVLLSPGYAPAWLQLGQLQFKSGRLDEAQHSFERRLALLPGDPYARLGLARVALQRGRKDEAEREIEALVRDHPRFPPSLSLQAEILAARGDAAGAERARIAAAEAGRFREADDAWLEALYPWCFDPNRLSVLATIDFQTNHGDKGRAYLEKAVRLAPTDAHCVQALSELYLGSNDPAAARALLERSIPKLQGASAMLYVDWCETYRVQHNSGPALDVVDRALKFLPDAYQLHNERGAILGDLGRLEESVAAYRRAVELAPSDTDSNFSLGVTLFALGRRDEAVNYFKRSLTLQPTYPKALVMLGRIELEAHHLDAAAQYLQPLLDAHPEQQLARELMAAWHLQSGLAASAKHEEETAESHYREGFKLKPNDPDLGMNLGTLYLTQNHPEAAIAPLEAYHHGRPEDPQAFLFLGQAYAQVGRISEARKVLQQGEQLATKVGQKQTAAFCQEILQHL